MLGQKGHSRNAFRAHLGRSHSHRNQEYQMSQERTCEPALQRILQASSSGTKLCWGSSAVSIWDPSLAHTKSGKKLIHFKNNRSYPLSVNITWGPERLVPSQFCLVGKFPFTQGSARQVTCVWEPGAPEAQGPHVEQLQEKTSVSILALSTTPRTHSSIALHWDQDYGAQLGTFLKC